MHVPPNCIEAVTLAMLNCPHSHHLSKQWSAGGGATNVQGLTDRLEQACCSLSKCCMRGPQSALLLCSTVQDVNARVCIFKNLLHWEHLNLKTIKGPPILANAGGGSGDGNNNDLCTDQVSGGLDSTALLSMTLCSLVVQHRMASSRNVAKQQTKKKRHACHAQHTFSVFVDPICWFTKMPQTNSYCLLFLLISTSFFLVCGLPTEAAVPLCVFFSF